LNTTHGLSLLGRNVYKRSYDYIIRRKGRQPAELIEILQGYIHPVRVAMDNILEALLFCKLQDVQKACC
ncbi:hypothetical protein V1506DRAFT_456192, partial [Lipomyces tetrasporus]